jgi:hypothetical protein
MKNLKYLYCIVVALIIGSCRDEDENPIPDFTKSSIPVFFQKEGDTGFIDFLDPDATAITFDVDRRGTEDVTSIDVIVTYNNNETGESETVTHSTVTSFPQTVNLTLDQLVALFPSEVVTRDTLSLGDSFVVGGNVKLADGRYLTGGYSPNVIANDPVLLTYNVACASDLAGTYDLALVSGNSGEASSLTNIAITQVAPGYYEIGDATMDIFGPDFPIKYRFTDICGSLTADAASVDYGSQISIRFNPGTGVDPATGVITFSIEYVSPSCCGLTGIKTVFTATPK